MDPVTKKISLDNGWDLYYDKCLIATGGRPNNLPVFAGGSDEMKKHVSVYRTVSEFLSSSASNTQFFSIISFSRTTLHTLQIPDYKALDEIVSNVKSILVVGGGFLGSELAVGLASRGEQVQRLATPVTSSLLL